MTPLLNFAIIILLLGFVLFFLWWRVFKGRTEKPKVTEDDRNRYSVPVIKNFVHKRFTEITSMNLYNQGLSKDEFNRQTRRRQELKDALNTCNTGDFGSKTFVREFIYDLLVKDYRFTEENINWAIPFHGPVQLSTRDMFDILLYLYTKKHKFQALEKMFEEYHLADEKPGGGYRIDHEEIHKIYKEKVQYLSLEDKLRIVVQRIYSEYKGFGLIDEIREMAIDGVSGGVSGLPRRMDNFDDEELVFSDLGDASKSNGLNSIWVMYQGKSIHLTFLEFAHEAELRRVVHNVYKYNFPGQLSEKEPYIINEMYDGSRVTVFRPKLSESWAFFIRKKYNLKKLEVEQLITHTNAELPINLMKYVIKGNRVTAITGAQGSGKTTLLMGVVAFINKALNLRIQETSFELGLRSIYPDRNILSFQETDSVSGQDGLDLQKKTDGAVNILGEVATDPVAAWMIQTAQVASLFTVFTHHAKTFKDLVFSLRNSLLNTGMFTNEAIAEQQVISVLEFDFHLQMDYDGTRYIERITECIPIDNEANNLEVLAEVDSADSKMDALVSVMTNYFKQQTQKQQFTAHNLVEFVDGEYVVGERMSTARQKAIESQLSTEDRQAFQTFIESVWGHVA